jgi:hypothetical protein
MIQNNIVLVSNAEINKYQTGNLSGKLKKIYIKAKCGKYPLD